MLVDSRCTLHLLPHPAIYSHCMLSNMTVQTANDTTEKVQFSGPATVHTVDSKQQPCSILLTQANYAPKLSSLLSVHTLLKQICTAVFRPHQAHIKLPDSRKILRRQQGNRDYLNFLVPVLNNTNTMCVNPLPPPIPHYNESPEDKALAVHMDNTRTDCQNKSRGH